MSVLKTIRFSEWWEYKLCPLLAVGYGTLLINKVPFFSASFHFVFLLLSMVTGAIYVSLINDVTDLEEDKASGKHNRMENIPPVLRWILPLLAFLAGLAFLFFLFPDTLSAILYILPCVSFSLYSLEPFRLKRRGFWGVLADACGSHVFPSLYFVSYMSYQTGHPIHWIWFGAVGLWALCYGLRGILWHQFLDRENDLKVDKLKTFAKTHLAGQVSGFEMVIFTVEMISMVVMLWILNSWLVYAAFLFYLLVVLTTSRVLRKQPVLIHVPPSNNYQILMLDFFQIFLPLSILITAIRSDHQAAWILLLHLMLFPKGLWRVISDLLLSFRKMVLLTKYF